MGAVYVEASHNGESDPAELDRYATDQAEEHIRQTLGDRADAGEVARGEPVLSPEVAEVSDGEIVIDGSGGTRAVSVRSVHDRQRQGPVDRMFRGFLAR